MDRGFLYMAQSALAFAAMGAFAKGAGMRLPVAELVLARGLVSLVLSLVALRRAGVDPVGHRPARLLGRGVIGALGLASLFSALARLPLAEATVIQYLHPVFTAVLAALLLRERTGAGLALSIALGAAGVLAVARPAALFGGAAASLDPIGLAAAVAGAFLSACAYVAVRHLSATEHPVVIVSYFAWVAVLGSLPFALQGFVWPQGVEWVLLVGVGVAAQVGQVAMTHGLRVLPAARATALSYLQVVFAAVLGAIFFGERPGAWTVLGALAILSGTLVALREGRREAQAAGNAPADAERSARA
jgi:drug/metabolite transporter (DMT)-like permease